MISSFTACAGVALVALGCASTVAVVQPGYRGLRFDGQSGIWSREVLPPGRYVLPENDRLVTRDVRYDARVEIVHATTADGEHVDVSAEVIERPVISELYELVTEAPPDYYETAVAPEVQVATREVVGRHTVAALGRGGLEDEILADLRRRTSGRHVEIDALTLRLVR